MLKKWFIIGVFWSTALFSANRGRETVTDRKTKSWVEQKVRSNPKRFLPERVQCDKPRRMTFTTIGLTTIGLMTYDCVIDGDRNIRKEIKQYDYQVQCENDSEYTSLRVGYGNGSFLVDSKGKIALRNEELCPR